MLETEPRDLLLDDRNDLVMDVDLDWSRGLPGVMQECRIKMQMFKGEWFLNLDVGVDYWGRILGQKRALAIAAAGAAFTEVLLSVEDVIKVTKMEIQYSGNTRALTITWRVLCKFGETPIDTLDLSV